MDLSLCIYWYGRRHLNASDLLNLILVLPFVCKLELIYPMDSFVQISAVKVNANA